MMVESVNLRHIVLYFKNNKNKNKNNNIYILINKQMNSKLKIIKPYDPWHNLLTFSYFLPDIWFNFSAFFLMKKVWTLCITVFIKRLKSFFCNYNKIFKIYLHFFFNFIQLGKKAPTTFSWYWLVVTVSI